MQDNKKMLPGFYLTIDDSIEKEEIQTALDNVVTIYAVLPELMKSKSEDGEEETYVAPNKPLLITSAEDAMTTLEMTDMVLTREVKNIIKLIPAGNNIALVRIVKRDGESPDMTNLSEVYEALDYAFSQTENFPIKEIIVAGLSMDKAVGLNSRITSVRNVITSEYDKENALQIGRLVDEILLADGTVEFASKKEVKFTVEAKRDTESGAATSYSLLVDGEVAKINVGEKQVSVVFKKEGQDHDLDTFGSIGVNGTNSTLTILKEIELIVGDEHVLTIKEGVITDLKGVSSSLTISASVIATKEAYGSDILTRIMKHNATITASENNCYTFLAPEPPKSSAPKDVEEYVNRCEDLYIKMRDRLSFTATNGKNKDLGIYLSVPVGVNLYDGVGGVEGFPQAKIVTIGENKKTIVTKKPTSVFVKGDIVKVYTHNKLDILAIECLVKGVTVSDIGTTEVELEEVIPEEIINNKNPKYIMNVNNKDFNGTYLARQYSNVVSKVGVKRSPAGINWEGECQLKFSASQLDRLDALKYAVLQQNNGYTNGAVSRSQLMTGPNTVFQNMETLSAVYDLVSKSKSIVSKYKGERIDDGADLALIKNELEDGVFNPAVNVYIASNYDLKLKLGNLTNANGVKEKTLYMDFSVVEITTLKLIRMTAKIM